jgi:hypothetical protein
LAQYGADTISPNSTIRNPANAPSLMLPRSRSSWFGYFREASKIG